MDISKEALIIFFQVPSSLSWSMTYQEYDDGPARHESFACKFNEQNPQMTILSNIPISDPLISVQTVLSVTVNKEQEETRLRLHHTLDWVVAFNGVWTSAGLWLQKRTWHYIVVALWWLSPLPKSTHRSTFLFQIAFDWMNLFWFVHCALLITKL